MQNSMTKSHRNESGTNDVIGVGCLLGYHGAFQIHIVQSQESQCKFFCAAKEISSGFFVFSCATPTHIRHRESCWPVCPEINHSHVMAIKLPPLTATSELSLQMVSGCSQWLIWWLIGAPIKARGMLEPPGSDTEWIINSTKSKVFSV